MSAPEIDGRAGYYKYITVLYVIAIDNIVSHSTFSTGYLQDLYNAMF